MLLSCLCACSSLFACNDFPPLSSRICPSRQLQKQVRTRTTQVKYSTAGAKCKDVPKKPLNNQEEITFYAIFFKNLNECKKFMMKQNSHILYNPISLAYVNPALLDPVFWIHGFDDWFIVGFCAFIFILKNITLRNIIYLNFWGFGFLFFFTPCYILWLRKVPHLPQCHPNPAPGITSIKKSSTYHGPFMVSVCLCDSFYFTIWFRFYFYTLSSSNWLST